MNAFSLSVNFFFCLQEVSLGVGENIPVLIQFDPSYKDDFVTRTAESQLEVSFKQHPQKVNNVFSFSLSLDTLDSFNSALHWALAFKMYFLALDPFFKHYIFVTSSRILLIWKEKCSSLTLHLRWKRYVTLKKRVFTCRGNMCLPSREELTDGCTKVAIVGRLHKSKCTVGTTNPDCCREVAISGGSTVVTV